MARLEHLTSADRRSMRKDFDERFFHKVRNAHFSNRRSTPDDVHTTYGNVIGFGLGEKITAGKLTGDVSLTVYVRRKVAKRRLHNTKVPKSIEGFPTDVIAVGTPRAIADLRGSLLTCQTDPAARQPRPFPAGVSVSGSSNTAGSIGYRVKREGVTVPMFLSNYHVLGNLDDPSDRPSIFQPGAGDGQLGDADFVGRMIAGVPLLFNGEGNKMDAAVAGLTDNSCLPLLCGFGRLRAAVDPTIPELVWIYGKTTRYSVGFVKDHVFEVFVKYGRRTARFLDQLLLQRHPGSPAASLADHGDSGSVVVKNTATACALLFASAGRDFAYATPISRILSRFKIQLV